MADTWEALEQACGQCRNCALAETRLHVVFGDGARAQFQIGRAHV